MKKMSMAKKSSVVLTFCQLIPFEILDFGLRNALLVSCSQIHLSSSFFQLVLATSGATTEETSVMHSFLSTQHSVLSTQTTSNPYQCELSDQSLNPQIQKPQFDPSRRFVANQHLLGDRLFGR
jgi:hypothetical protein